MTKPIKYIPAAIAVLAVLALLIAIPAMSRPKIDYPAALMADDVIYICAYQEIEDEIPEDGICYTTSYTDTFPRKNGQSNFARDGAAYARYQDGLAVRSGDEWVFYKQYQATK